MGLLSDDNCVTNAGLLLSDQGALKQSKIKRIVYVSCNPSSFARDIDLLKEDYEIKKATVVDMFAYTTGVECVALLERK